MLANLQKLRRGQTLDAVTYNKLVDRLNIFNHLTAGNGIQITTGHTGISISQTSVTKIASEVFSSIVSAVVIQPISYLDPSDTDNSDINYYTVRLESINYLDWDIDKLYSINDYVTHTDNRVYRSLANDNIGNDPLLDINNINWELSEEIRIYNSIGFEATTSPYAAQTLRDLRNCVPWYTAGQRIFIIKREDTWYIVQTIQYTGEEDESSLRWNQNDKRTMSVFK